MAAVQHRGGSTMPQLSERRRAKHRIGELFGETYNQQQLHSALRYVAAGRI
jgi:hypothetical protein